MSVQPDDIISGYRHRRDFKESRWRFYSEKARLYHEEWMEAERALISAELRRVPVMAPPIRLEIVEDESCENNRGGVPTGTAQSTTSCAR